MDANLEHEERLRNYEPVEQAPIEETNELNEYFKSLADREALRQNLRLTPAQRLEKMERLLREKYPDKFKADTESSVAASTLRESSTPYSTQSTTEDGPPDATKDLVEAFKKDVDRTLLIENLKLTPAQRMEKFEAFMELVYELRRAGQRMREREQRDQ